MKTYNVYFRNEDKSLGKIKITGADCHEEAILEVVLHNTLLSILSHPTLAVIPSSH